MSFCGKLTNGRASCTATNIPGERWANGIMKIAIGCKFVSIGFQEVEELGSKKFHWYYLNWLRSIEGRMIWWSVVALFEKRTKINGNGALLHSGCGERKSQGQVCALSMFSSPASHNCMHVIKHNQTFIITLRLRLTQVAWQQKRNQGNNNNIKTFGVRR